MFGQKKPLNALSNPVEPFIQKSPPRFVDSGKHWMVDVGQVLKETEHDTQFITDAVLSQPWDYNETKWGKSSAKFVVNKNFRPPLLDPIDDFLPLSRIPRKEVSARTNPSTAHNGGFASHEGQGVWNLDKFITDNKHSGTLFTNIEHIYKEDNTRGHHVLKPVAQKTASAVARTDPNIRETMLTHIHTIPKSIKTETAKCANSGKTMDFYTALEGFDGIKLTEKMGKASVTARKSYGLYKVDKTFVEDKIREGVRINAHAGIQVPEGRFATRAAPVDHRKMTKQFTPIQVFAGTSPTTKHETYRTHKPHFREKIHNFGSYRETPFIPRMPHEEDRR